MFKSDIIEYYEKNYENKNHKKGRSVNIPEKLFKDYKKFCIDKEESVSKRIRLFMVKDMVTFSSP